MEQDNNDSKQIYHSLQDSLKDIYYDLRDKKEKLNREYLNNKSKINELDFYLHSVYSDDSSYTAALFSPRSNNVSSTDQILVQKKNELLSLQDMQLSIEDSLHHLSDELNVMEQTIFLFSKMEDNQSFPSISPEGISYVLSIAQNEKNRISRDLHDDTIQNLVFLSHKAELVSKYIDQDPIRAKIELEELSKSIQNSIIGIREMLYDLKPISTKEESFNEILDQIISETNFINPSMEVNVEILPIDYEISNSFKFGFHYVVKEFFINSAKYSKAKHLYFKMYEDKDGINIHIEDDGIGFILEEAMNKNNHFGLKITQNRVCLLNGRMEIITKPGDGTKINLSFSKGVLNK